MEEKEIQRKEKELFGTVRLPAEAEAFKLQTLAEGQRYASLSLINFYQLYSYQLFIIVLNIKVYQYIIFLLVMFPNQ